MTTKKATQQPAEVESTETTEAVTAPPVEHDGGEGDVQAQLAALRLRVEALKKEIQEAAARRSVRRSSGSPTIVPTVDLENVPKLAPDASEIVTVRESRGGMRTSKGWTGQTTSRHLDRFLVKDANRERIGYVIRGGRRDVEGRGVRLGVRDAPGGVPRAGVGADR
jgi:hypothetical protein